MSDAIKAVVMPKWGLAMEEGTVLAWHRAEGEAVGPGDELVDIETTKITNVMEAQVTGTLRRRIAGDGETLAVGALLAVVSEEDISDGEIDDFVARFNDAFADRAAEASEQAVVEPESLKVAGRTINFLRLGQGDGVPLVLVHGFGGDLNNWLFNQPALAESAMVFALDLPGHGRSSKDVGAGDMALFVDTLAAFLDALGIERAYLVGHSLGGAIALALAADHPARVVGATLISPAALGPEVNADFIAGFIAAGRRKAMKDVLGTLFADPALISRDMVEQVLKFKRLDGVEAALTQIAAAFFPGGTQALVLRDALGGIAASIPLQVIWGAADQVLPAAQAEGLPEAIQVHLLDGVGHMAHMEAAAEVNRLILEAL